MKGEILAELVARAAEREVAALSPKATAGLPEDIGEAVTAQAQKQVSQIVEQDPWFRSWRVGSIALTFLSALLMLPDVQMYLIGLAQDASPAWLAPIATQALAGVFAAVSKARDIRPVRGQL